MSVNEEIREQRKKLKGQGFKAHWNYFWDYYKIHVIVGIVVILILRTIVHDVINSKPYALYAMLLNSKTVESSETVVQQFKEYVGDDFEGYNCFVDTSATFDTKNVDQMTIATSEKIMATISAGEMDVMAADKDIFAHYATQDIYMDLRNAYSAEELAAFGDNVFYVDKGLIEYMSSDEYQEYISNGTYDESNKYAVMAKEASETGVMSFPPVSEMDNPIPVGIILSGSKALKSISAYADATPIIGIISNSSHLDTDKSFISFLYE